MKKKILFLVAFMAMFVLSAVAAKSFTKITVGVNCSWAIAYKDRYDSDWNLISREKLVHCWTDPFALEEVTLFGRVAKEPASCLKERPKERRFTGVFEYSLFGNYKCILETTKELGGSTTGIPARFLNKDYTSELCRTSVEHVPDGTWKVRQIWE